MRSLLLIISIMGLVLYKAETIGSNKKMTPFFIPASVPDPQLVNYSSPVWYLFSAKAVDGVRNSPASRNHWSATDLIRKTTGNLPGINTKTDRSFHLNASESVLPRILLAKKE